MIGAGIAGLSAAWLLNRTNRVTLYEKEDWLGGHANTVDVDTGKGFVPVDTGFIVFNEPNYPNLAALFSHLGVKTEPSDMSFAASVDNGKYEYSSAGLNQYLGQRRNLWRPRFWRMSRDLLRFSSSASSLDSDTQQDVTLGEYLGREGYSATFVEDHILPLSAAIWSTTPEEVRAYPLKAFVRFFASHALFDLKHRPQWRTVSGGSREYVRRMVAELPEIRTEASRIERSAAGVIVEDTRGRREQFSEAVIATHADQALALLADPDPSERRVLGSFNYTSNQAVLHSDPALMPRRRRVWSSWNFIGATHPDRAQQFSVTYWMNRLQNLDYRWPLFVSLNPCREIKPDRVVRKFTYSHPHFDQAALAAQGELEEIQGCRHTWFCGAYSGYGFHEDGLRSGLAIAEALGGGARPWKPVPDRSGPRQS